MSKAEYDYVIVGGGSAGCVMAYRLSENPANRVLLLEAGGDGDELLIKMPRGLPKVMGNLKLIWSYLTKPEHATNDGPEFWARGKMLGGSSAVNGMMYVRGFANDYDHLAELTSPDWSWSQIEAAYRAMEDHELGVGPSRGKGGPLAVSLPTARDAFTEALIKAGESWGLKRLEDVNDPDDSPRIGYAARTIHRGQRETAKTAFLDKASRRANLTIRTNTLVDRILFEETRAIGVLATDKTTFFAKREVIVTAGALASPAILQRSGIGDAGRLSELGIPVIADLHEVGRNLFEHRGLVIQWKAKDSESQNRELKGARLLLNAIRYFLTRRGTLTAAAYELGAWFRLDGGQGPLDSQFLLAPYTFDYAAPKLKVEDHGGFNICLYPLRPSARGSVSIESADPAALPAIVPAFASDGNDIEHVIALIRKAREFVAQSPLKDLIFEETRPGSQFQTDAEIREAHRRLGFANYHASGTCRMGKDDNSVVDPRLRVRGTTGLRVADTAIFPFMLAGNTQAPAMGLAWRGADLILADNSN